MVRKSHGPRRKTRKKLQKRELRIRDYLQEFKIGDAVAIVVNPSSRSMVHPRFHGITGKVIEKRGRGYVVEFKNGNKTKKLILKPEHLKKVG